MAAKNLSNLGVLFTERRDFDIFPSVYKELWTDITPFLSDIVARGTIQVQDPDFKMFEHRSTWIEQKCSLNDGSPPSWSDPGAGAGKPGATAVMTVDGIVGLSSTVDDTWLGLEFEIWDSTLSTYKGVAICTAVSNPDMTLKALGNPASGTDVMGAPADNDVFIVRGTGFGEGTSAPEAWADELKVVWNSPQIFKTAVEVTGTLYATALKGYSNELARLRLEKAKEHRMQKNLAFLYGVRANGANLGASSTDTFGDTHQTDAAGKKIRTTMGIISALRKYGSTSGDQQNIFSVNSATYNYSQFVDDMEKIFQYQPTEGFKNAYCGPGALSYWSKVDSSTGFVKKSGFSVQLDNMQRTTIGYNFRQLVTPHGILRLIYEPGLRGPYRNTMVIVDPANLNHVQFRSPLFQANIKTDNAYDGVKDQYFSDEGLGIQLIESHSMWTIS